VSDRTARLDAIRQAWDAATSDDLTERLATVCAIVNAVPWLLEEIEKAELERDEARAVLRDVEWEGVAEDSYGEWPGCPACSAGQNWANGVGSGGTHAPDCALAANLPREGK
jgi:hypothetical protein